MSAVQAQTDRQPSLQSTQSKRWLTDLNHFRLLAWKWLQNINNKRKSS